VAKKQKPDSPVDAPPVLDAQKRPAPVIPQDSPPGLAPVPPETIADDLSASVDASLENLPAPNESAIQAHADRQAAERGEETPESGAKQKRKYTKRGTKDAGEFVAPGQGPASKREQYRKSGYAMADTLVLVGQTLGGEDWKPNLVKDAAGTVLFDERSTLREAWADMAEEYEITKMPAWAACAIATAAYVGPRLTAPSTISRWEKAKLWWAARQMKAADAKAEKEKAKSA